MPQQRQPQPPPPPPPPPPGGDRDKKKRMVTRPRRQAPPPGCPTVTTDDLERTITFDWPRIPCYPTLGLTGSIVVKQPQGSPRLLVTFRDFISYDVMMKGSVALEIVNPTTYRAATADRQGNPDARHRLALSNVAQRPDSIVAIGFDGTLNLARLRVLFSGIVQGAGSYRLEEVEVPNASLPMLVDSSGHGEVQMLMGGTTPETLTQDPWTWSYPLTCQCPLSGLTVLNTSGAIASADLVIRDPSGVAVATVEIPVMPPFEFSAAVEARFTDTCGQIEIRNVEANVEGCVHLTADEESVMLALNEALASGVVTQEQYDQAVATLHANTTEGTFYMTLTGNDLEQLLWQRMTGEYVAALQQACALP